MSCYIILLLYYYVLYQTKHVGSLFPVSLQAKRQWRPSNYHCISAVPAGFGRNTEVVDKNNTKGIVIIFSSNLISLGPAVLFFLWLTSHLWCKGMEKCSYKMSSTKPLCASWFLPQLICWRLPAIQFMLWTPNSILCSYEVNPKSNLYLFFIIASHAASGEKVLISKSLVMVLKCPTVNTFILKWICECKRCTNTVSSNWTNAVTSHAGDQDPSCSASSKGDCQSQLFIFHFGKPDIIKQYTVSLPDSPRQQNAFNFNTLEEACNLYLQQRFAVFVSLCLYRIWICILQSFLNIYIYLRWVKWWFYVDCRPMNCVSYAFMWRALSVDERNKALMQTWKQLQETTVMVQQKHGSWRTVVLLRYCNTIYIYFI